MEKGKYACWRAGEIRKAVREGRAPSAPRSLPVNDLPTLEQAEAAMAVADALERASLNSGGSGSAAADTSQQGMGQGQ